MDFVAFISNFLTFFSNGDKITSLIDVKDCINTEPSNVAATATTIANKIIEAIKNIQ